MTPVPSGPAVPTARICPYSMSVPVPTKMGCPAGSKGTEFVRQLADVDGYDFVDGNLVLKLKSNAGVMRFAPVAK